MTEKIRTDNTDTFKNALNKIVELEEENAKLQEDLKHKKIAIQNRKARIKDLEKQLKQAKEIIKSLLKSLYCWEVDEIGEIDNSRIKQAEQFLEE